MLRDVPLGGIIAWSGAIVDIPSGFTLCDGNNGTPDLRNRFVPGAGAAYAPDDSGSDAPHAHAFTANAHNHTIDPGVDVQSGADLGAYAAAELVTGTTDTDPGLPKYWALAYIMYVGV